MTWDRKAALDVLEAISPSLVRRLRMTDPGDTVWQQYTFHSKIDGKEYDSTIRVELRNKRGKRTNDAPPRERVRRQ